MSWGSPYRVAALGCLLALAGCGQAGRQATSSTHPEATPGPEKIETGGAPIGLLAYDGAVWVADAQRSRLLRVAPQSGRVTGQVPVGRTPLRIVA